MTKLMLRAWLCAALVITTNAGAANSIQIIQTAKTLGAGEVRYFDGRPVSTNRRLLNRYHKTDSLGATEYRRDRTVPVDFPRASLSAARLTRDDRGRITLHLLESWDLFQDYGSNGYLGEAGFNFHHDVAVEFTAGTWDDFEAGQPFTVRTTFDGARAAAADLAEIIGLSAIFRTRDRPLALVTADAHMLADLCGSLLSTVPPERRKALAESDLNALLKPPENPLSRYEVTGATPILRIEVSGTKSDFTVRYLNDVLVEATGYFAP